MKLSVRKYIKLQPELESGYNSFIKGFITIGNLPWIIMGIGILSGTVNSLFEFFTPALLNPVVLLFHGVIIAIWIYTFRLVYYGNGAEFIENHPGIIKFNGMSGRVHPTAKQVKRFFPIALIGGIIAMTAMWFIEVPVGSFP